MQTSERWPPTSKRSRHPAASTWSCWDHKGPCSAIAFSARGRVVVDRDPTARQAFETQTIIEYLDWKPTHDIAMEATLDGLRRRFAHGER
jgi:hypothetical protein